MPMGWYSPKKGLLLGSLFLLLSLAGCLKSAPEPVELRGRAMGTSYKILYLPTAETPEESEVQGMVALTLSQVEQKMSTYLKDSELSKLNQAVKPGVYPVSKETYRVLSEALTLGLESGGALDITVMPLVDLWGFGPTEQKGIPPEDQIQEALAKTGLDKLALDPKGGQIQKKTSNLTLDLSSIAKGYGVDQVSDLLKNLEIKNHMVEIGGEIRGLGERPGGGAWRIGIEEPVPEGGVNRVVELSDQSMATSGDYRNFFSEGGKNPANYLIEHLNLLFYIAEAFLRFLK